VVGDAVTDAAAVAKANAIVEAWANSEPGMGWRGWEITEYPHINMVTLRDAIAAALASRGEEYDSGIDATTIYKQAEAINKLKAENASLKALLRRATEAEDPDEWLPDALALLATRPPTATP
jgi:hypothetical protein